MIIDETVLLDYIMGALTPDQERAIVVYLSTHPEEAAWVRDMFEAVTDVTLSVTPEALEVGAADALLARIRQAAVEDTNGSVADNSSEESADAFGAGFDDSFNYDEAFGFDPDAAAERLEADEYTVGGTEPQGFDELVERPIIRLEPRRRALRTFLTTALAASLLVAGWLGFREPLKNYQIAQRLNRTCISAGVRCEAIQGETGVELGTLVRLNNTQVVMVFKDKPPENQVYQAWEIAGDTPISLGVWSERVLEIPQSLAATSTFGITLEPPGGSPQPTSTPIVAVPLSG